MLFTIILPFYNGKTFVREAIDSVVNQDYPDWELLVIDDGSNEDNRSYISHLVTSYERDNILLFRKDNEDVAIARNYGIERANGDYICLLDQDDYFHTSRLRAVSDLLVSQQYDFIFNDRIKLKKDRIKLKKNVAKLNKKSAQLKKMISLSRNPLSVILLDNPFVPVDVIFRRKFFNEVGPFNPEYRVCNDWDMWIRMIAATEKILYLAKTLSYYRLHDANTSIAYEKFEQERIKVLENFFQQDHTVSKKLKQKALAAAYQASAKPKYKNGRYKDFRADVIKAFHLDPYILTPKTISRYFKSFLKK